MVSLGLGDPEDSGALGMKCAIRHKLVDRAPLEKGWVKLE